MGADPTAALVAEFSEFDRVVEIGIGNRTAVAAGLVERGTSVTATDVVPRETPPGVSFVQDDLTAPDSTVYAEADAIYALRCPPELQPALRTVASDADARAFFTTLGGEPVVVPTTPRTIEGETLFAVATPRHKRAVD